MIYINDFLYKRDVLLARRPTSNLEDQSTSTTEDYSGSYCRMFLMFWAIRTTFPMPMIGVHVIVTPETN